VVAVYQEASDGIKKHQRNLVRTDGLQAKTKSMTSPVQSWRVTQLTVLGFNYDKIINNSFQPYYLLKTNEQQVISLKLKFRDLSNERPQSSTSQLLLSKLRNYA
jgi:hypothetical protein